MHLKVYKTQRGWVWEVRTKNGKTVAISARAYSRLADAKRAFQSLDRMF
jgi:uncharacterized protein YegP (UPF0339 family)